MGMFSFSTIHGYTSMCSTAHHSDCRTTMVLQVNTRENNYEYCEDLMLNLSFR